MTKDFLSIADLSADEIWSLLELAKELKASHQRGKAEPYLQGKTLAMLFMKPSTRTRISFETGMFQLGGHALYLSPSEIGLGKREAVADVARVLSRYNDGIMARLFEHETIEELAAHATVPVINGLTDLLHPCQILGDLLTIWEQRGTLDNLIVTFIGDGNNVANSWINASAKLDFTFRLACPEGYEPNATILQSARASGVGKMEVMRSPMAAAKGAHVLYTDVWASMGQEEEAVLRRQAFNGYVIDTALMQAAASDAKFMHCLPAHRGEEVTHEVMESPASIIFDQAENRLHIQKAILVKLMAGKPAR